MRVGVRLVFFECTEDTVASIAEAGEDVAVLIELAIDCCGVDRDVRVFDVEFFDAFRSCDQADEADVLAAFVFKHLSCCDGAATCSKHRVDEQDRAAADLDGQALVVFDGFEDVFIAEETDVADVCVWEESNDRV